MESFDVTPAAAPLVGYVTVPGDKSVGHRALLFGALSATPVRVVGLSSGADNRRSARAAEALGARLETDADGAALVVHGAGLDALTAPAAAIDCSNSGTSMRLLCGLLAGQPFATELAGDESLGRRPMRRVADPLHAMGAVITGGGRGADPEEIYPPLTIAGVPPGGRLRAIEYRLPIASAQVKSAVLLAGLYADGVTTVVEPGTTRDHTERMLAHMGAPITTEPGGVVRLDTRGWDRRLACDRFAVPGDPSSAAFVLAAALVAGAERVTVGDVGINPTRTGFLDALAAMGANVERQAMSDAGGEPTADLVVARGAADALTATTIDGDLTVRSIDEIPVLAVVAARARGTTHFRDAAELRVKESDRIATTCAMLRAFGVAVDERPDGFSVHGDPDRPLSAARIDAAGDHRIAMAAAVAGLAAGGPTRIDDTANVATSFPTFRDVLAEIGATIQSVG